MTPRAIGCRPGCLGRTAASYTERPCVRCHALDVAEINAGRELVRIAGDSIDESLFGEAILALAAYRKAERGSE